MSKLLSLFDNMKYIIVRGLQREQKSNKLEMCQTYWLDLKSVANFTLATFVFCAFLIFLSFGNANIIFLELKIFQSEWMLVYAVHLTENRLSVEVQTIQLKNKLYSLLNGEYQILNIFESTIELYGRYLFLYHIIIYISHFTYSIILIQFLPDANFIS